MSIDVYALGIILLQLIFNKNHPKNIPDYKYFYELGMKCNDFDSFKIK